MTGIQGAYGDGQTREEFEKAETLLQQKKHGEALALYEGILNGNPAFVAAYPGMLKCYTGLGDSEGGAVFIETLYLEDPDNAGTNYGMGYVLFQQKQYPTAAVYFDRAIELDPGMAESWNNRAAIYHFVERNYRKAREYYQEAIALGHKTGNQRVVEIARTNLRHLPEQSRIEPVTTPLSLEEFINRYIDLVERGDTNKLAGLVKGQRQNCEQAMGWLLGQADAAKRKSDPNGRKTAIALARLLAQQYRQCFESDKLLIKLDHYEFKR